MNKEKILLCLSKVLEKDIKEIQIFPENFALIDIGLDSIKVISFVVELENTFGFKINDNDLLFDSFETLMNTYKTLQKYFKTKNTDRPLKKCLILDCDGVLWKGIAGEEDIIVDEKIIQFQNQLVRFYKKGILLCLCSKNEQENLIEAFLRTDMILSWEHIIISKSNTNNKVDSIREIATELNISIDSFVFADDDYYEIELVNSFIPEIDTVKVDYNGNEFIDIIQSYFASNNALQDFNRTKLYKEQKERLKSFVSFNSIEEYNESLETKIICDIACIEHIERIVELSQRTNQFNLANENYSKDEVESFIKDKSYVVLYLSVSDKYGDMGIVSATVVHRLVDYILIKNFMLSCRVFGRNFEYIMIDKIKKIFEGLTIFGIFKLTDKNIKHKNFYLESGVKLWQNSTKL